MIPIPFKHVICIYFALSKSQSTVQLKTVLCLKGAYLSANALTMSLSNVVLPAATGRGEEEIILLRHAPGVTIDDSLILLPWVVDNPDRRSSMAPGHPTNAAISLEQSSCWKSDAWSNKLVRGLTHSRRPQQKHGSTAVSHPCQNVCQELGTSCKSILLLGSKMRKPNQPHSLGFSPHLARF